MSSFCPQCGCKVKDGAKFCGQCGYALAQDGRFDEKPGEADEKVIDTEEKPADTDEATEAETQAAVEVSQAVAEKPETAVPEVAEPVTANPAKAPRPKRQTLGTMLKSPVKIGLAFVPLYAAIIVALITTIGVAYAAFMLYENVIEPAIVQMQQGGSNQDEAPSDDAASGSTEEASSGEKPTTYTAEGNPQSVLQLAEILAMDPTKIPGYLSGEGLERVDYEAGEWYSLEGYAPGWFSRNIPGYPASGNGSYSFTSWEGSASYLAIDKALGEAGIRGVSSESGGDESYSERLMLGDLLDPTRYDTPRYLSASNLSEGQQPNSIAIRITNLSDTLSEDEGNRLAEACGFKSVSHYWTFTTTLSGADTTASAWCGVVSIGGSDYVWYICNAYYSTLFIGCIPMTEAESDLRSQNDEWVTYYGSQGIVSHADLANASNDQKALYFAQLLVDDFSQGNGGPFVNVVTGEAVTFHSYAR